MIEVHEPIRVLVVDDHELIRRGLSMLLHGPYFCCVGEANDGNKAVEMCNLLHPDVVLMDLQMPGLDGFEATRMIRRNCPETQVIALTSFTFDDVVVRALEAGAISFIHKSVSIEELTDAIRAAAVGQSTLSSEAIGTLIAYNQRPQYDLTAREQEILNLIAHGLNNREIGEKLYITNSTVKNHITNIFAKIGVTRRSSAVALAVQQHLVEVSE